MRQDKFMLQGMTFGEASIARKAEREANKVRRAQELAARQAAGEDTTCQICARRIMSRVGVIAHHGYTRPGDGWQSASCYGARHLAWEKSCAIIPLAIKAVEAHLATVTRAAERHEASPPAILTRLDWNKRTVDVAKPADFVPQEKSPGSFQAHSYASLFYRERDAYARRIRQAKMDKESLGTRYEIWHKLHPECEGDTLP